MKKLFSLLTLALLTMSAWAANTYVKVTSADQLEAGKKYILVNEANQKAMGAIDAYGASVSVAISNGVVDIDGTAVVELTLGEGLTFDVNGEGNYICWNAGNSLNVTDDNTTNYAKWTASDTNDGVVLTNNADNTRKLQYNQGSPRFACYTSNQKPAVLYVQKAVVTVASPTLPAACTFEDSYTVVITNNEAGATLYYSTDGLAWTEGNSVTITETTTVYAKASKDGVDSPVVSETYTKVEPAEEGVVVFIPAVDKGNGSTNRAEWTIAKDGVTMVCSDGTVYDENYRIYQNATLTFTSTVGNITKIEFTGGDNSRPISNLSTETGTLTTNESNGTWVGDAAEIVFSANAQARATEIRVYIGGEVPIVVAAPTFNPAACEFEEPFNLTITAEEGATIYYNYDNGENWTEYTAPLPISETTTVYAKAVIGEVESAVVSATYTYKEPILEIESLEIASDKADDTEFRFTGNAVVTYQYNAYLYIKDDTGYGLIYGNTNGGDNPVFVPGTELAPNWEAKVDIFHGLTEFVSTTGLDSCGFTAVAPEMITADQMEDKVNAYVQIDHVKSVTGTTATLADGTTINLYKRFGINIPEFNNADAIITGIVSVYDGTYQINFIAVEGIVAAPVISPASCNFDESIEVTITAEDGATIKYSTDEQNWNTYSQPLTFNATTTVYAKAVVGTKESVVVSATYNKMEPVTYTLVTDVAQLADGDKIIFVGYHMLADSVTVQPYAMANFKTNNFAAVAVEQVDNTITTVKANVFTLNAANEGKWNFLQDADGRYLHAAGNDTQNYLKLDAEAHDATITITDEVPVIEFVGENATRFMRFNDSNADNILFSCYKETSSIKNPVYIFKAQTEPVGLRGDVDLNGEVGIADATLLIDLLLSASEAPNTADANLDGEIGIADVTSIIDYLLSGNWPE